MRLSRTLALGASVLVLVGACSTGGGARRPRCAAPSPSSAAGASPSAARQLGAAARR